MHKVNTNRARIKLATLLAMKEVTKKNKMLPVYNDYKLFNFAILRYTQQ